jgi:hypothetical protein
MERHAGKPDDSSRRAEVITAPIYASYRIASDPMKKDVFLSLLSSSESTGHGGPASLLCRSSITPWSFRKTRTSRAKLITATPLPNMGRDADPTPCTMSRLIRRSVAPGTTYSTGIPRSDILPVVGQTGPSWPRFQG